MRKVIFAILATAFVALGITAMTSGAASAQTLPHQTNCSWAKSDPTCIPNPPGASGNCNQDSFAHGGCTTDDPFTTLSDTRRGPQDPCIIHRPGIRITEIRGQRDCCQPVWDPSPVSWTPPCKPVRHDPQPCRNHRHPRPCKTGHRSFAIA